MKQIITAAQASEISEENSKDDVLIDLINKLVKSAANDGETHLTFDYFPKGMLVPQSWISTNASLFKFIKCHPNTFESIGYNYDYSESEPEHFSGKIIETIKISWKE